MFIENLFLVPLLLFAFAGAAFLVLGVVELFIPRPWSVVFPDGTKQSYPSQDEAQRAAFYKIILDKQLSGGILACDDKNREYHLKPAIQ